jgi:hypothetical protein
MILAAVLSVMLTACGGGGGEAPNLATEPPGGSEGQAAAEGDTITGKLGGDPQLEGGCAWVDDGKTRWQVQYPDDYQLTLEPLSLTGPGGLDAREGDTITVTGSEQGDAMTTCQVGPVWIATSVTAGQ